MDFQVAQNYRLASMISPDSLPSMSNNSKIVNGTLPSILIPVMGQTGAGKSTFINNVVGLNAMKVGDGMESCTVDIVHTEIDPSQFHGDFPFLQKRHLFLVDTPGFDDTYVDDSEILERISKGLANVCDNYLLGGVIYLHDLSLDRMMGSAKKNLDMFNRLWEENGLDNVVLGGTKSNRISDGEAEKRIARLSSIHWTDMMGKGARVFQCDGSPSSASRLVRAVLEGFGERANLVALRERMERKKTPPKAIDKFIKSLPTRGYNPLKNDPDIVIPVIGLTGVGKSTFINAVLGQDTVAVGQELESCTADISVVEVDTSKFSSFPWLQKHHLLLVDTQGFDDTFVEDSEILERIAKWLEMSYRAELVLGGVVYLHDISNNRYTGTAKKNLAVFNRLCGDSALKKIVLGTTMTSRLSPDDAERRLGRLKEAYWNELIRNGAQSVEFDGTHSSALNLVNTVLRRFEERTVLEIQRELVDKKRIIPETEAGKELRRVLQQSLNQGKRRYESSGKADLDTAELEAPVLDQEQIDRIYKQLDRLEVPFFRRFLAVLGF